MMSTKYYYEPQSQKNDIRYHYIPASSKCGSLVVEAIEFSYTLKTYVEEARYRRWILEICI